MALRARSLTPEGRNAPTASTPSHSQAAAGELGEVAAANPGPSGSQPRPGHQPRPGSPRGGARRTPFQESSPAPVRLRMRRGSRWTKRPLCPKPPTGRWPTSTGPGPAHPCCRSSDGRHDRPRHATRSAPSGGYTRLRCRCSVEASNQPRHEERSPQGWGLPPCCRLPDGMHGGPLLRQYSRFR